jgi:hypothetical protein
LLSIRLCKISVAFLSRRKPRKIQNKFSSWTGLEPVVEITSEYSCLKHIDLYVCNIWGKQVENQLENTPMSPVFELTLTYLLYKNLAREISTQQPSPSIITVFCHHVWNNCKWKNNIWVLWKFLLGKIIFIFISWRTSGGITYVHTCMYTRIYIYMYIYTHIHNTYIYTHIRTHTHTHIYTNTHSHTHTYTYVYVYMCVYIYIYTHTHTHAHTYIHTYIRNVRKQIAEYQMYKHFIRILILGNTLFLVSSENNWRKGKFLIPHFVNGL